MGEWTWLHVLFPAADIALTAHPIPPKVANVIVRTCRPLDDDVNGRCYQLRVAPHNVAPFGGGPWTRIFPESALAHPGDELDDFREKLAAAIAAVYPSAFK